MFDTVCHSVQHQHFWSTNNPPWNNIVFGRQTFSVWKGLYSNFSLTLHGIKHPFFIGTIMKPRVKLLIFNWFQNGTEMLKTVSNVSKVYDEVEREQARLYNPFIITLSKTPVQLVYPYYYRGVSSKITSTGSLQRERGREGVRRGEKLLPRMFFRLLGEVSTLNSASLYKELNVLPLKCLNLFFPLRSVEQLWAIFILNNSLYVRVSRESTRRNLEEELERGFIHARKSLGLFARWTLAFKLASWLLREHLLRRVTYTCVHCWRTCAGVIFNTECKCCILDGK